MKSLAGSLLIAMGFFCGLMLTIWIEGYIWLIGAIFILPGVALLHWKRQ